MSIKISIKNQLPLDVMEGEIKKLDMKRSLSGQIMVFNHIDMDIVLYEKTGKVIAYSKKDFANLYETHNLMSSLFPYTASCTGTSERTNNFTEPCRECFWCKEKYWAFNMYDYPEAYNL